MGKGTSKMRGPQPPSYFELEDVNPKGAAPRKEAAAWMELMRQCRDDMLDAVASGTPSNVQIVWVSFCERVGSGKPFDVIHPILEQLPDGTKWLGYELSSQIRNTLRVGAAAAPPGLGARLAGALHHYLLLEKQDNDVYAGFTLRGRPPPTYNINQTAAAKAKILEDVGVASLHKLQSKVRAVCTPAELLQADINHYHLLERIGQHGMAQRMSHAIKVTIKLPDHICNEDKAVCAAQEILDAGCLGFHRFDVTGGIVRVVDTRRAKEV